MRVYRMSELNEFLTCERRYQHKYVENLEPMRFTGVPRDVGTAVHVGVEQLYKGASMADALVAAKIAFDMGFAHLLPSMSADDLREVNNGWEQAKVCIAKYPYREVNDPAFRITVLNEVTLVVDMGDGRGLKVRLDRLVTTPEGLFVHDTKTTGLSLDLITKAQRIRYQFVGYAIAAEMHTGTRPLGVIVDYIAKPRAYTRKDGGVTISDPKYAREPINVTDEEREEFPSWFHRVVDRMEEAEEIAKLSLDPTPYLKNSDACSSFNRLCPFWDLCARPKFAESLKPTLYRVRPATELQAGASAEE